MEKDHPKIHVTDKRGSDARPGSRGAPPSEPEVPSVDEAAEATASPFEDAQKLADDRLDQLMRLKADFENFRKREIREKTQIVERASMHIVERLLPVLDDLDRALLSATEHGTDDGVVRGVELVRKQLHDVLKQEGLELVETNGAFDPEHHEAVASVPSDVAEPTVLEVVRPGYRLKGKTIRPALVQVSVPQGGNE
jgi:molecular chaperone GrpE